MGAVITTIVAFLSSKSGGNKNKNKNFANNNNVRCCYCINVKEDSINHNNDNDNHNNIEDDSEEDLVFDNYFLTKHPITRPYYCKKNISYFTCDVNGVATSVGKNMEKFVGLTKEQNLQSISWVANLAEDNYQEYMAWVENAKLEHPYVKKMHFRFNRDDELVNNYLVIESHPVSYNGKYAGLKGVALNLPKKIWTMFIERDFEDDPHKDNYYR